MRIVYRHLAADECDGDQGKGWVMVGGGVREVIRKIAFYRLTLATFVREEEGKGVT